MATRPGRDDGDDLPEAHEINVTPFIDVMLVLLIVFMIAAPLATVDVPVELPAAAGAAGPRPDRPLFLTLRADRGLALGEEGRPVVAASLGRAIDAETGGDRTRRVFLRADGRVPYDAVMATMNLLRHAGYLRVALVGLDGDGAT